MNDDLKTIIKCEDAIESIEKGCVDTSTGILKKIIWIKDDTKNVEFKVDVVKLTMWQKIRKRFLWK